MTIPNELTKEARPWAIKVGTHSMFWFLEVNGDATDASASDKEMPAWATFNKEIQYYLS